MNACSFACVLSLVVDIAVAQPLEPTRHPPAQFDHAYDGPGRISVYYLPPLEVSVICLGLDSVVSGFGIPSCALKTKDGCDIYIRYGESPDELVKQRARCKRVAGQ